MKFLVQWKDDYVFIARVYVQLKGNCAIKDKTKRSRNFAPLNFGHSLYPHLLMHHLIFFI